MRRVQAEMASERMKQETARARAEAEEEAKELVAFLRDGGAWSMEVPAWDEAAAPAAPGAPFGPGAPPGGAAGDRGRKARVLVLGPRDLLNRRKSVKLEVAEGPGTPAAAPRLDDMTFDPFLREALYRQFAEALGRGEVGAALVEAALEVPGDAAGPGSPWRGAPVPLEKAKPLTREEFTELAEGAPGPLVVP
jgi:hypothetical protein